MAHMGKSYKLIAVVDIEKGRDNVEFLFVEEGLIHSATHGASISKWDTETRVLTRPDTQGSNRALLYVAWLAGKMGPMAFVPAPGQVPTYTVEQDIGGGPMDRITWSTQPDEVVWLP